MAYNGIRYAVLEGKPRIVEKSILKALENGASPKDILEKGLLSALDSIEDNMCEDETQITTSLACAKAMKKGIDTLESVQGENLYTQSCSILIGTAAGDLHDMGKNIVALYFRSAGFNVVDLGVDVTADQFIQALEAHPEVGIVCISVLLKTSLPEVKRAIQSIRSAMKNRKLYIMIGGGSMTAELAGSFDADCYTENAVAAVKAARAYAEQE